MISESTDSGRSGVRGNEGQLELEEVHRYQGKMANPRSFHVVAPNRAVIIDPIRDEAALTLVDLREGTELNRFAAGSGPGQIQPPGDPVVTQGSGETVWVWQQGNGTLSVYEADSLDHLATHKLDAGLDAVVPVTDSLVMSLPFRFGKKNALVQFHPWSKSSYRISNDTIERIPSSVDSLLNPLRKNSMLRSGSYTVDHGEVFIGFDYSSSLIRLNASGIQRVSSGKTAIPFPSYSYREGGTFKAPDVSKYPLATVDLAVDSQYVYVLHHGRTFNMGTLGRLSNAVQGNLEAAVEEWKLTDRVLIYDRASLSFICEGKVPYR